MLENKITELLKEAEKARDALVVYQRILDCGTLTGRDVDDLQNAITSCDIARKLAVKHMKDIIEDAVGM